MSTPVCANTTRRKKALTFCRFSGALKHFSQRQIEIAVLTITWERLQRSPLHIGGAKQRASIKMHLQFCFHLTTCRTPTVPRLIVVFCSWIIQREFLCQWLTSFSSQQCRTRTKKSLSVHTHSVEPATATTPRFIDLSLCFYSSPSRVCETVTAVNDAWA